MIGAGADDKRYFKYSYTSCEVLCCEVDEIYTTLLHDDSLLEKLFSFLDGPRPLNLMRAGYVARVVLCLLMRRTSEILSFLEGRPEMIDRLVAHIDTTSIAEVGTKMTDGQACLHLMSVISKQECMCKAWSLFY